MTEYRSKAIGITVLNVPAEDLNHLTVQFKMSPAEAKALTSKMVWRFTGKTVAGVWEDARQTSNDKWVISANYYQGATLDSSGEWFLEYDGAPTILTSVSLVNRDTGETLKQFSIGE